MNEIIKQLKLRKSVRVFTGREIKEEEKRLIIQSAIEAPTAGNQSMYTIIDITDQNVLNQLADSCDHQPFIADAKMALIFCADYQKWYDAFSSINEKVRKPAAGEFLLAVNDALIAAQNAVVAAESLGIGSCYIGDIMEQCEFHRKLLHLPKYVFPAAFLVFGYPSEQQLKRRKPERFTYEQMVCENYYHQKNSKELKEMFKERGQRQEGNLYQYEQRMEAFCKRKYESDFALEMSRSIAEYLKDYLD